jgi:hypothetical protein
VSVSECVSECVSVCVSECVSDVRYMTDLAALTASRGSKSSIIREASDLIIEFSCSTTWSNITF